MRPPGKSGDKKAKKPAPPKAGKSAVEDPRERIRRAATHLMARRGFGAISVNDVAQAAGITKQALLYHYPSREALHEAVLDALIDQSNRHLVLLLGAISGRSEERLAQVMTQLREFFDSEPDAPRVVLRELLDREPTAMARILRGMEPWLRLGADTLRQAQQEGRVRKDLDPEAAVAHVGTLLLTSFALDWHEGGWPQTNVSEWRTRRLSEAVLIIQRYLFAPLPPPPAPRRRRQTK